MASKQWYELDEKLTGRRYAMALVRKQPSAVLLLLQILIIILMPWFDGRQHARAVVMVEQIAGVFYIAMVISRLVAMSAMRRS